MPVIHHTIIAASCVQNGAAKYLQLTTAQRLPGSSQTWQGVQYFDFATASRMDLLDATKPFELLAATINESLHGKIFDYELNNTSLADEFVTTWKLLEGVNRQLHDTGGNQGSANFNGQKLGQIFKGFAAATLKAYDPHLLASLWAALQKEVYVSLDKWLIDLNRAIYEVSKGMTDINKIKETELVRSYQRYFDELCARGQAFMVSLGFTVKLSSEKIMEYPQHAQAISAGQWHSQLTSNRVFYITLIGLKAELNGDRAQTASRVLVF